MDGSISFFGVAEVVERSVPARLEGVASPVRPTGVLSVTEVAVPACAGVAVGVLKWLFRALRRWLLPGRGVMTSLSFWPASAIQVASLDSSALRYSCCDRTSCRPGKKSRAMILERALV